MKFAFRADASLRIGIGHIARCLTLAEHLRDAGHEIAFVCRELPGGMNARLRDAGFSVRSLRPLDALKAADGSRSDQWLGVSSDEDAVETWDSIADFNPDWLLADHYGIDARWEKYFRGNARKIMVIDDLANRLHDCDLLLDQNLFFAGIDRYQGLVPDHCELLIGPTYALLNREYSSKRDTSPRERTALRRILLYFGGGDTASPLILVLAVLSESEFAGVHVDVIANPKMAGMSQIEEAVARHGNAVLYPPQPNLADMMSAADFAIGGGGASTWERMCLGCPAAVVVMADNQRILAAELAERGLTINLGDIATLSGDRIRDAVRLAREPGMLTEISARIRSVCDGHGARRVCDRLTC